MASVTITDRSGRTLSGQTLEAFLISIEPRRSVQRGDQLCAGPGADAAVRRGAFELMPALDELPSQRRAAQRVRRLRRNARANGRHAGRVRRQRLAEHRGRLLRHDARAHPRDCRKRWPAGRPARAAAAAATIRRYSGLEPLRDPAGQHLHHDRRADQRFRLAEVRPAGPRRQPGRGRVHRPAAGRGRGEHHRRQHGRGPAGRPGRDDQISQPDRRRARHRPRAGDDRQLELGRDRGGPEMRAGQADRQFDQPQGRRGGIPASTPGWCGATARPAW